MDHVSQIWGAQYNRKFADIFAVQEEIAREISEKLRVQLTGDEKKRLTRRPTQNKEAYQLYLKALYFWNKWSPDDFNKAIEYSRQAIDKEPGYAPAYAMLANSYSKLGSYGFLPPAEAFPKAKAAALKALEIDESLPEAHVSLALTLLVHDWDWSGAERECRRALALNPDYSLAHQVYGRCLGVKGRMDEALAEFRRSVELDPLSPASSFVLGSWLFFAREYDQAIEQLRKTLDLEPSMMRAEEYMAWACAHKGRYEEAFAECQKMSARSGGHSRSRAVLGYTYALAGKLDEARSFVVGFIDDLEQELDWRIERCFFHRVYLLGHSSPILLRAAS